MNPIDELQSIIDRDLPLAACGGFQVYRLSRESVCIRGELESNKNHHGTVFGGSQSVALILSGWAQVRELMKEIDPEASIVIASQSMDYILPVSGDFEARCTAPEESTVKSFYKCFRERGKAKMCLTAEIYEQGSQAVARQSSDKDPKSQPASRMTCLFVVKRA